MKHFKFGSRTTIRLILVITAFIISGCVGSGLRNIMTEDKPYGEYVKNIPDIPKGYGRVFIYSPKGGPSYPLNSMGDIDFFSIDKKIYRFGGASYFYLDIKSGLHVVTVTNVLVRGFASNKKQYGRNKIEINVNNQQTSYLRFVNLSKSKSIDERAYSINFIEKNTAEREMAGLAFWNNYKTAMEIVE